MYILKKMFYIIFYIYVFSFLHLYRSISKVSMLSVSQRATRREIRIRLRSIIDSHLVYRRRFIVFRMNRTLYQSFRNLTLRFVTKVLPYVVYREIKFEILTSAPNKCVRNEIKFAIDIASLLVVLYVVQHVIRR